MIKTIPSHFNPVLLEIQPLHQNPLQDQLHVINLLLVHQSCLLQLPLITTISLHQNIHILRLHIRRKQYHTPSTIVNQPLQFLIGYMQFLIRSCNEKLHPLQNLLSLSHLFHRLSNYPLVSRVFQPMEIHFYHFLVVLRLHKPRLLHHRNTLRYRIK